MQNRQSPALRTAEYLLCGRRWAQLRSKVMWIVLCTCNGSMRLGENCNCMTIYQTYRKYSQAELMIIRCTRIIEPQSRWIHASHSVSSIRICVCAVKAWWLKQVFSIWQLRMLKSYSLDSIFINFVFVDLFSIYLNSQVVCSFFLFSIAYCDTIKNRQEYRLLYLYNSVLRTTRV